LTLIRTRSAPASLGGGASASSGCIIEQSHRGPAPGELSCAGAEEARSKLTSWPSEKVGDERFAWTSSLAPLPGASSADKSMEFFGLELLLAASMLSIFSLHTFCRTALPASWMLLIFSTEGGRRKAKLARVLVLNSRWFAPRAASGSFICKTIEGLNHQTRWETAAISQAHATQTTRLRLGYHTDKVPGLPECLMPLAGTPCLRVLGRVREAGTRGRGETAGVVGCGRGPRETCVRHLRGARLCGT